MKKSISKRFMASVLMITLCIVCNMTVFAAEPSNTTIPKNAKLVELELNGESELEVNVSEDGTTTIMPRGSLSGYNQVTFSGASTSFNIEVSGSYSTGCGMTIKATSPDSSAWGYVSVYKPNGELYKNSVYVDCAAEKFVQMYFCNPGTYKIVPTKWYNPASSVTIQVWIYA